MTVPLGGSWYWCIAHQVAEFVTSKKVRHHIMVGLGDHDCVGPYPTEDLAEEFGQRLWGPRNCRNGEDEC